MIPIIYAIDGKSFPKPPSSCEHTVTQVVTKASRTVGKGALLNKELLAAHIRTCVAEDIRAGRDETIDELVTTLQKLMK